MATATSYQVNGHARSHTPDLNTLADPRAPSPLPNSRKPSSDLGNHPDLSDEVAALSTKLINAINHQTTLDDALQGTRHELEAARQRMAHLELEVENHKSLVGRGLLVNKSETDKVEDMLRKELLEERRKRNIAERNKRGMEQELENLTSTLFEEANGMVSSARKDHDASEKRADQLKGRLKDTEALLAFQQEQLRELKTVLEQMQTEKAQTDVAQTTAPSTPMTASYGDMGHPQLDLHGQPIANGTFNPEPPLHYSYLVQPVLRSDLSAYEEFVSLLKASRSTTSHSRGPSGNFSGLNVKGFGALNYSNSSIFGSSSSSVAAQSDPAQQPLSTPTSNPTSFNSSAAPTTPSAPGAFTPSSPQNDTSAPLKDSRFYKRALTEDIEPTLRLDIAPSLSFLSRRTVLSTISLGTLIVEPLRASNPRLPSPAYASHVACALCGELRRGPRFLRRHRFRTSEAEDAQKYPLCDHCVARLRAVCDFVSFLRCIRAGFWRGDGATSTGGGGGGEDESNGAWEECVRLRERMFWARLGGGVIPAGAKSGVQEVSPATPAVSGTPRESMEGFGVVGDTSKAGLDSARPSTDASRHQQEAPPPLPAKDEPPRTPGAVGDAVVMTFEPVPSPVAEPQPGGASMPGSFQ